MHSRGKGEEPEHEEEEEEEKEEGDDDDDLFGFARPVVINKRRRR
jgi:ribosomal protein L12E/L44/L45/RPP1/RPP2